MGDSDKQKPNQKADKPWLWKPGQSGNPKGRPKKGLTLTDKLRTALAAPGAGQGTKADEIVARVTELAMAGEKWAVELIWTRLEGRLPVTTISHLSTDDGEKIIRLPDWVPTVGESDKD